MPSAPLNRPFIQPQMAGSRTLLAAYNLQFAPLPQGVTIQKITCVVTELLGKPQRITFQFSDLPLP